MRLLIVGNSYMYFRTMGRIEDSVQGQLTALAEAAGKDLTIATSYIGGGTLEDHWNDTLRVNAREEISRGIYDVVLMNGGDGDNFDQFLDRFARLADQNGADLVVNGIWTIDQRIDASGSEDNQRLHDIGLGAAQRNDLAYVPNALVMTQAHAELTRRFGNGDNGETAEDLLTGGNIHANPLGTYLIANAIFRILFDENPPRPGSHRPDGVSQTDAQLMYNIAASVVSANGIVLDGSGTPNPPPPPPPPPSGGGTISGLTFIDRDGDGRREAGDQVIEGLTVELYARGNLIASTVTDANGRYLFDDLPPATYKVRFEAPDQNQDFTRGNTGRDATDSDVIRIENNGEGTTGGLTIRGTQSRENVDAGYTGGTAPQPAEPYSTDRADYANDLRGNSGNNTLNGTSEGDFIRGFGGNDRLSGRGGDDYLNGGGGADTMNGGSGDDVFIFDARDREVNGGSGIDKLLFNTGGREDVRNLDLTSVELLDMQNGQSNLMILTQADLTSAVDGTMRILGDRSDDLRIETNLSLNAAGSLSDAGITFDRYRIDGTTVLIDADIDIFLV